MRRRKALARRARKAGSSLPSPWLAGVIVLVVALGLFLWSKRHRLAGSENPPAPAMQVDRDKPLLIKVFFGAPGRQRLEAEARTIYASTNKADQAKQALLELFKGPRSGLVAVVPEATGLKELYLDEEGTAYVDLSGDVASGHPGGVMAERLTIAAVVNTLMYNFPDISRVRLFVEGEPRQTLAGHVRVSGLLGRDRELVRRP